MIKKIKILHLEDLSSDAELVERALLKGNIIFDKIVVDTKAEYIKGLHEFLPDIVLSDHSLPSFNSLEALQILQQSGMTIPFILVTATVSEEFAVTVLKKGADDYILKDNLSRLPSAITHAIETYDFKTSSIKAEEDLQAAHKRLLFHLENSPLGYIEWDNTLKVKTWSKRAEEIFGWTQDEFNAKQIYGDSHIHMDDRELVHKQTAQLLNGTIERNNLQNRNYTKCGKVIWCEWFNSVLKNKEGHVVTIMTLIQDITERKEAEQFLISSEYRFREFFETAPEAIVVIDPATGFFTDYNDNALQLLQFSGADLRKKTAEDISAKIQADGKKSVQLIKEYIQCTMNGQHPIFEWIICDSNGKHIFCEVRLSLLANDGMSRIRASVIDITQRILLEKKLIEEKVNKQIEITDAVITAQEMERSFLGEELHDNINQILATSKLYVDVAINAKEIRKDLLDNSRKYIIKAMEEIRKLSKTLLPPSLGDVSLYDTVNDMLENIQQVNRLKITTHWNNVEESQLSDKLKVNIFRIIQEQFNNIIKHARAKNVFIHLEQKNTGVKLIIKDDGTGFDTEAKRKGVGLKNITSRADFFKGTVKINSSVGKGCELTVKFNSGFEKRMK